MNDLKNLTLAYFSSVSTVFAAVETRTLITIISAVVLPIGGNRVIVKDSRVPPRPSPETVASPDRTHAATEPARNADVPEWFPGFVSWDRPPAGARSDHFAMSPMPGYDQQ